MAHNRGSPSIRLVILTQDFAIATQKLFTKTSSSTIESIAHNNNDNDKS